MNEDKNQNQEVSSGQGCATGHSASPPQSADTPFPVAGLPFEEIPIGYPMDAAEFNRLKSAAESVPGDEPPDYGHQPIAPQEDSDDGRQEENPENG
ncbi:MAG TPA: hypothetical protein VGE45_17095 [Chloroflexia bacterium]